MALTAIEIYKYLPKTNCKDCGFPTCLAFAMKLAQKGAELSACKHVSEEAKSALEAASRPPIRLVTIGKDGRKVEVGNEVAMFRHEKTFYHQPGLLLRVKDSAAPDKVAQEMAAVASYKVERVGMQLSWNGLAIQNDGGDKAAFLAAVKLAQAHPELALVLMSDDPDTMAAALGDPAVAGRLPLIYAATEANWQKMAALAKQHKCPLAVRAGGLDALATLTEQVAAAGIEDIVVDPGARDFGDSLNALTQIRRLALKKSFRPLGYPVITFPGEKASSQEEEVLLATQHIARYAGVIVLDHFSPAMAYPLLTERLNIYTDPQKPLQMQAGVYPFGKPDPASPLLVTTNFSLTYFSVSSEIESSGFPTWLMVVDTEGQSVLTSWASGKFDAEKISKAAKNFKVEEKIGHRSLVIPGAVAVLRGELEGEFPEWKIMVGPREAVGIGPFLKQNWAR
ncbi:MAG: acetyl-CoA decarbonylase/synthase complex subunit gamma [Chloroflexi bacterium]|nr:acetyl-CoA decarbonylase/synthase complex subunit gamma [Chloroflexota bacterium]